MISSWSKKRHLRLGKKYKGNISGYIYECKLIDDIGKAALWSKEDGLIVTSRLCDFTEYKAPLTRWAIFIVDQHGEEYINSNNFPTKEEAERHIRSWGGNWTKTDIFSFTYSRA